MVRRFWASISHPSRRMTVEASPFNGVKLALAILLMLGIMTAILTSLLPIPHLVQLTIVVSYGLMAMAWLLWRTIKVTKQVAHGQIQE